MLAVREPQPFEGMRRNPARRRPPGSPHADRCQAPGVAPREGPRQAQPRTKRGADPLRVAEKGAQAIERFEQRARFLEGPSSTLPQERQKPPCEALRPRAHEDDGGQLVKEPSIRANGISSMNDFKIRLSLSMPWIAALMALVLCGPTPLRAQQPDSAARRIQSYYQQLMPTLRLAGQLSVRERDQRFGPAITSAFDIGTMARLATGPAWSSFSGAQQAAVREAFARFLVADYASEVTDYSGESFVVDPQTSPESRGGGEIVKTKLIQPGGRNVTINYLVRGGRVVDVYLNGTVSDLATRRDEFASILAGGGGADALVKTLRERTATLLGG